MRDLHREKDIRPTAKRKVKEIKVEDEGFMRCERGQVVQLLRSGTNT